jgi:hypothetical protein
MKKITSLFLASLFVVTGFSSCALLGGESNESTGEKTSVATLWSAENTISYMQDDAIPENAKADLSMDAMKGETESIQLMITAKEVVSSFNVSVGDLVSTSGSAKIEKSNIEIFAEKYIETKKPSVENPRTANMYIGFYPDALIPIDKYVKKKENKIDEGMNQGIWFNVNIPVDAKSGDYEGTVTVTLNGEDTEVPLKLKVYDLAMPQEIHNTNSFGLWYHYIQYGEGDKITDDTYSNYYWYLANKRITPTYIPYEGCDLGIACCPDDTDGYAEALVEYANNGIVSGYGLPCNPITPTGKEYSIIDKNMLVKLLTSMIEKNIALHENGDTATDLFKKAYIYAGNIIDEPRDEQAEQVKACDKVIIDAKNQVKDLLSEYPDLQASLLALKHVVTITPKLTETLFEGDDMTGGIQTWCPYISEFNSKDFLDWTQERLNSTGRVNGEDFWWYNCIEPENPFPSYQLDDNLIAPRVMEWMKYDYNISGHVYWSVNFWYKCLSFSGGGRYTIRDIWNDPNTFEKANGDGHLIYPGSTYALKTPISTLRLESIREGNEDYEYLWMFEQKIEQINETKGTDYDCDKILESFYSRIYTGVVPKTDVKEFKMVRSELLQLLEKLYNDMDSAIEILNKING